MYSYRFATLSGWVFSAIYQNVITLELGPDVINFIFRSGIWGVSENQNDKTEMESKKMFSCIE